MDKWQFEKNIESTISSMPSELKQYFDLTQLNKMLQNHFSKKEQNGNMIWAVYVLINWYNEHRNSYKLSQA
jgi:hypothetical protein